ncbi:MFS transporter [Nesterenkonia ebinurensis]|uniref:hypothetical protein n=1 Tax=Nesterenkonia ebinurensis TaxID=2608252 RepID=UPI00123CD124|nr:hypothetical protein [Nesterenkonia ebinurensis]
MSAATAEKPHTVQQQSSFARVPAAFRLQFINGSALVWVPLMIFLLAWAIAVGIGFWIDYLAEDRVPTEEPFYTGASQASLWGLAFMAAYAGSHTFPFSMALSYSRRVFTIGAVLAFGAVSVAFGLAFLLGAVLERATNGFGIEGYTFYLPYLTEGPGGIAMAGVFTTLACLTVMQLGFGAVILYKRVGLLRLWLVIIAAAVVILATVMLITQQNAWPQVWQWLVEQSALSLSACLVLVVLAQGVINYLMIRKATPA